MQTNRQTHQRHNQYDRGDNKLALLQINLRHHPHPPTPNCDLIFKEPFCACFGAVRLSSALCFEVRDQTGSEL